MKDKKLEVFTQVCSNLELRNQLFLGNSSIEILEVLALREFAIKQLLQCPTFDLLESLLPYEFNYAKISKRDRRVLKVTKEQQLEFITSMLNAKEVNFNSLYLFTGVTDFEKIRFIAFLLAFWRLRQAKYKHTDFNESKPYYYLIKGGFEDALRDIKGFKEQLGKTNLLILDGLNLQSSKLKIEKVIDIINIFSTTNYQVDIIVLAAGLDPLALSASYLNTTFQAGLYLDEGLITKI